MSEAAPPPMRKYLASSSSNRGVCRIEINDTKAGMENIDREKINAIIMKNTLSNDNSCTLARGEWWW